MEPSATYRRCLEQQAAPLVRRQSARTGDALTEVASLDVDGPHLYVIADALAERAGLALTHQGCAYDPSLEAFVTQSYVGGAEVPTQVARVLFGDAVVVRLAVAEDPSGDVVVTAWARPCDVNGDEGDVYASTEVDRYRPHGGRLQHPTPGARDHITTWLNVLRAIATDLAAGYELPVLYPTHPDAA